ncbi:RNA methyltransferase [Domibacillus sp. DTU_2020_1001157_1_SI_ALB_TIR_016]|uniref:TrmH family RNA methyltransferase n=1 Tax=Domibacillus sp. DTU_2020_1001157_1_SI_ALB_TIR_016 TaxID=3077789 RepID=UPI0028E74EFD|nr:RNA methyltransferase [Domibacillus sp. DTU_2020_1001157_1_SI_ALB_TIR_016]WNS81765.1 RNA methyltransferase [Domibacillus sp. DTU_2020_1001157_1_SI_ALB_TIR_016]
MTYIQSANNTHIKQLNKLWIKKERDKTGLYMLEGFHLVEEALRYKEQIKELLLSEEAAVPASWNIDGLDVTMISAEVAKKLSDTENGQGVFAVCRKQEAAELPAGKSFLLLDAVQDPGNIGTMIRTADAAGIDAVLLSHGSADLYNPKVLRSAQGSHFHLPVLSVDLTEAVEELQKRNIPVYGTALEGASDYRKEQAGPFALLVGNEGNGVRPELLEKTTKNVYIPIFGQSESLNVAVAAGILLYHFRENN